MGEARLVISMNPDGDKRKLTFVFKVYSFGTAKELFVISLGCVSDVHATTRKRAGDLSSLDPQPSSVYSRGISGPQRT